MDKKKIDYFKEKLIKEQKDILYTLNQQLDTEYGSMDLHSTEISVVDNHPGDIGTEVFLMEQGQGFENQLKNVLKEIKHSLIDIKNGKYGFCKLCGKKIYKDRLEIIPYIKTCLDCSRREENLDKYKEIQKDNENYIYFNINDNEDLMYDREDIYQDVAKFNIVSKDSSYSTGDNMGIMDEVEHGIVDNIEKISQEDYDETLD